MTQLPELKAADGFHYSSAPQRSEAWFKLRIGKRTASRLEDWLSVSKAKASLGKPLKKRLDYEKELVYEQLFNVSYNNYISDAMNDGINLEEYARKEYERQTGNEVEEVGAWFNDFFVASPDGAIGEDGLLEIKIVRDNTFSDILSASAGAVHMVDTGEVDEKGKPILKGIYVLEKHWKQIQGGLWASGRKWCDYVVVNANTKKIAIVRVTPDTEFHEWLALAIPEEFTIKPEEFNTEIVHDLIEPIPDMMLESESGGSYFN